jgi:hypothetical protein
MAGASHTEDDSSHGSAFTASPGEAGSSEDSTRPFQDATRSANADVREAWASLDGMFKAIHDRMGPVDHELVRRRDALYDLLEDNGVEAMALLEVLKELQPHHALDVAMAVEADARDAWNQAYVEARHMAQVQSLHEERLASSSHAHTGVGVKKSPGAFSWR